MALNDVKEITIPEGSVKKIEDSNGNIIWGSQSAFPYRRLEYIKFSGAEYIPDVYGTNPYSNRTYQYRIMQTSQAVDGTGSMAFWGLYIANNTNLVRFYPPRFYDSGGIRFCVDSAWTNTNQLHLNDILTVKIITPSVTSGSNQTTTVQCYDNTTSSWIVNTTVKGNWARQSTNLGFGALYDTRYTPTYNNWFVGRFYWFRNTRTADNFEYSYFIPCQRKSDGICGIYDTKQSQFWPMYGTNITDAAAGPILDEYWDLTDPA